MIRQLTFILVATLCAGGSPDKADHFACKSMAFELESFKSESSVPAPDGASRIQLRSDYTIDVMDGRRKLVALEYKDLSCCIEVGWSPDSTQFFVMYGDSGGNGSFMVHWYTISHGVVSENHANKDVANDFSSKYSCHEGGPNNLFFLGWTGDSKELFFVTEVAGRDCGRYPDHYEGYLVDAKTQEIIRRYGAKGTDRIEKSCRASGVLSVRDLR